MEIKNDLFDIAARIREIDPRYFVVYDEKTKKYQLHSHTERPTFILAFPYDELDCRAIIHTAKTRAENVERLIEEIERHNLKVGKEAEAEGREALHTAIDKAASEVI